MLHIRQCSIQDFDEVILLLRQLWLDNVLDKASLKPVFVEALASATQKYFCATDENRVVGFGSLTLKSNLWPEGRLAIIDELVVDNEYRGQGIGSLLLDRLVSEAQVSDCCRVELDSAFYRKDSHKFYEHHGFQTRAYVFSKVL